MMYIQNIGHRFEYDVIQLLSLFMDKIEYEIVNDKTKALDNLQSYLLVCSKTSIDTNDEIKVELLKNEEVVFSLTELLSQTNEEDSHLYKRRVKRKILQFVHTSMSTLKESKSPWGILVGVRPVKIVHEFLDNGKNIDEIRKILTNHYCIREDKAALLIEVAETERTHIYPINKDNISIYVSIPFCPTRCLYCSFPSNTGKAKLKLMGEYVNYLINELKSVGLAIKDKKVETIYIGGGTPTTLEANDIKRIIDTIKEYYDLEDLKEITVEAGRPDTITKEKLVVLKECGVGRICVNPQTMNDETIKRIGRKHTSKDIEDAYLLAKEVGFKTINMDLILGLPGETLDDVRKTFQWIKEFKPENVTIHTLAVKKNADLRHKTDEFPITDELVMNEMIDLSSNIMQEIGLHPYYMYRQKYMAGNLENVGYSIPSHESVYNMQIMEEKQTILAFGAGAVSKMCYPEEDRFERVPNVKGLEEYIARNDEMIHRKVKFFSTF